MRPTPRFWAAVGVAGVLCLFGVALATPVLVGAAAVLVGALLGCQARFAAALGRLSDTLSVEQSLSRTRVPTDQPVVLTLRAQLAEPTALGVTVDAQLPLAVDETDESDGSLTPTADAPSHARVQFSVPTAGATTFDRPSVTAQSAYGLFTETFEQGDDARLRLDVEPRAPRRMHIGQGGERISAGFGEHSSDQRGPGLEPAEIRQYQHGDDIGRIDWKATARLNHPHIRDFEVPSARQTTLILDHRGTTAAGPAGETKLDFLREIGLAYVNSADALGDPVGLYTVGDDGATNVLPPKAGESQHRRVRSRLRTLEPTDGSSTESISTTRNLTAGRETPIIADDGTEYAATLRPYYRSTNEYTDRFSSRPLFATVRRYVDRIQGSLYAVILTDDTARAELYEAVKALRRREGAVLVFITPTVFFESALSDVESAYAEYEEFESFRKRLNKLTGVSAFEVAPQDRLAGLLRAHEARTPTPEGASDG
ncbi:DUF58 domain-containing protein [Halobellus rubicundus]|uniref:DUF58 domain-containing protein n=1 Tax=Halobellus rubicundus TaxID=2996466 RepID=A0ABD5MGN8_9EURY